MPQETLAIVGVGLIGGSLALAVRLRPNGGHCIGVDNDPAALAEAQSRGVIDEIANDVRAVARRADIVVFCTPVDALADQVLTAAACARPGTIFTDVGSTKAAIVRDVEGRLPPGVAFVGGHPLAGSEKQGVANADAELFRGRVVVLTPTATTNAAAIARLTELWNSVGARVVSMSAEAHDRALALTSHLPHLAAAALCGILPREMLELTASGFRDTTRVAAGESRLWTAILNANRDNILPALDRFQERLAAFHRALSSGDRETLQKLLAEGQATRLALNADPPR